MGIVIQGPWKKRNVRETNVREIIEHELLVLGRASEEAETTHEATARWPAGRSITGVASVIPVFPKPVR